MQVDKNGKSLSKLATILKATKHKSTKKNRKKLHYKHLDKPVSTMSSSLYTGWVNAAGGHYISFDINMSK